jgi:tetratricopeptide (TPR) repeat protein
VRQLENIGEQLRLWVDFFVNFLGNAERQSAIKLVGTAIAAIAGSLWFVIGSRRNTAQSPISLQVTNPALIGVGEIRMTIEEYDRRLRIRETETIRLIALSNSVEQPILEAQLKELKSRIANIEPAYEKAASRILELETSLKNLDPGVSEEEVKLANNAFGKGDFALANEILGNVAKKLEPILHRAARIAYWRGIVAEEAVDWPEAATQFSFAATLERSESNLLKASLYLWRAGDYQGAISTNSEILEMLKSRGAEISSDTAGVTNNLAAQFYEIGQTEEAISFFEKSLSIKRQINETASMDYAGTLANLGNVYIKEARLDEAEKSFRDALRCAEDCKSEDDERFSTLLNGLAEILRINGKLDEAEKYFDRALSLDEQFLGMDHPFRARDLHFQAKLYCQRNDLHHAKLNLFEARRICATKLGDFHPQTLYASEFLASILFKNAGSSQDKEMLAELIRLYGENIISC